MLLTKAWKFKRNLLIYCLQWGSHSQCVSSTNVQYPERISERNELIAQTNVGVALMAGEFASPGYIIVQTLFIAY